jgi:hypothetical protein
MRQLGAVTAAWLIRTGPGSGTVRRGTWASPDPGQCLPDRAYLTGARTLSAPAAGARAASGPAGLAGIEAEALCGAQPAHMTSPPPRLTIRCEARELSRGPATRSTRAIP